MKSLILISILILSTTAFSAELNCQKKAEAAAVSLEQKENKKEKFQAKNTTKEVSSKDQETYVVEVHDSKGSFVPYDVVVKKSDCKIISAKATTL